MFRGAPSQLRPARFLQDALVTFFALTILGAPAFSKPQDPQKVVHPEKPVPVTRLLVTFGTNTTIIGNGGFDELRIVIRDRATWENVWKRLFMPGPYRDPYKPIPSLPEIDFSREMLIVAAMGQRPSGHYGIQVSSAHEKNNRLEVEVHSVSTCGMAPAIVTAPIDIVRTPRTELPVTFREIEIRHGCK